MKVFLRLLRVIGIILLILLSENRNQLFPDNSVSDHFVTGIIGFLLFFLIAESARELLLYLYRKRKRMGMRVTDNVTVGLDNIYILLMAGAIFYLILHFLNLRPKDFFTGITLISAAIAIIMKDYISNIISGMILAFSEKLKIGDYVQVSRFKGEIVNFSLTSITLKNDDDEIVYIPINIVFTQELINYTNTEPDSTTVNFELNNKMKIPIDLLQEKINQALVPYRDHLKPESTTLRVSDSKQESTVFKYRYTLMNRNVEMMRQTQAAILKAVYENTSMPRSLSQ